MLFSAGFSEITFVADCGVENLSYLSKTNFRLLLSMWNFSKIIAGIKSSTKWKMQNIFENWMIFGDYKYLLFTIDNCSFWPSDYSIFNLKATISKWKFYLRNEMIFSIDIKAIKLDIVYSETYFGRNTFYIKITYMSVAAVFS